MISYQDKKRFSSPGTMFSGQISFKICDREGKKMSRNLWPPYYTYLFCPPIYFFSQISWDLKINLWVKKKMLFIPLVVLLIQNTPLRLSQFLRCSLEMTSYRITSSKIFNWSMLPYRSVPIVLYIPPQCHNPDVHTHVKREKNHGQQSSCTPTQAGQTQLTLLSFLQREHWQMFPL